MLQMFVGTKASELWHLIESQHLLDDSAFIKTVTSSPPEFITFICSRFVLILLFTLIISLLSTRLWTVCVSTN